MRTRARPGSTRGHVDGLHVVEIAAGDEIADRRAAEVEEAHAQRLREAGAGVVGGRAADPEDDLVDAARDRILDELARAVGGGDQRVALVLGHQRQAGGLCHLDDGGALVAEQPIGGEHPVAHRAGDLDLDDLAAGGIDQRLHGALAAIGHGHLDVLGIGPHALEAGLDLARHLQRRQVLFEGIGGDDDLHGAHLLAEARAR